MSCFVDVRGINHDGNIYRKAQAVIATARRKVLLVQTGPAPNPNNASDTINQWRSVYIVNQTTHFELQICRLDKGASDPELVTTEAFKAPPLPWLWSGIPYVTAVRCSVPWVSRGGGIRVCSILLALIQCPLDIQRYFKLLAPAPPPASLAPTGFYLHTHYSTLLGIEPRIPRTHTHRA